MGPMAAPTELPLRRRRARPADLEQVLAVYRQSPGYFETIGAELPTEADVERELLSANADAKRRVELIFLAGEPVGLVDYRLDHPEDGAATLSLVLVVEAYRGLGIGQQAVRELERDLAGRYRTLYALVYGENPGAERFFTTLGYRFQKSGGPAVKWFLKPLPAGP